MVNEMAKRLIFQCFPRYSVADTLKNTLSGSICHCRFVADGTEEENPLAQTGHQIFLADDAFVSALQQSQRSAAFRDTPRQQRRAVRPTLAQYQALYSSRDENGMRLSTNRFSMSHIAAAFHVSSRTVSQAVSAFSEAQLAADGQS